MSVVKEKQRKAYIRILEILKEKKDIRHMLMEINYRKRLLGERDLLANDYYQHIKDWGIKYYRWIRAGKVNELEYFRLCEDYRKLLNREHEVRFGVGTWNL